jgi:DNA-binding HxlR family transcriptional regulator
VVVRSYGQYCALAKSLDGIGDRWSLLIVRELMLLGPCRYTDLMNGLPGIATNLLADRLRHLEEAGVVKREAAPPPIATSLFHLTPRGEDLLPVIRELGRWGAPLLAEANEDDAFRSYWITLPLELYYYDPTPDLPPVTIEVRTGDEPMVLETIEGRIRARRGSAENPDAVLTGPPQLIIGVLSGQVDLEDARREGLEFDGDPKIVSRVRSTSAPATVRSSGSSAVDTSREPVSLPAST